MVSFPLQKEPERRRLWISPTHALSCCRSPFLSVSLNISSPRALRFHHLSIFFFPSPELCICSAPHSSLAVSSLERFTRVPLVPPAITFTFFSSFERSRQDLKPCYYPKRHAESAHPQCFRLLHTSLLAFPPALPPPTPLSTSPVLLLLLLSHPPPWRAVTQEPMQR